MDREALVAAARERAAARVTPDMGWNEKVDVLEQAMMELLDIQIMTPTVGRVASWAVGGAPMEGGRWLMGDDPRLPPMSPRPTLMGFFRNRLML